MLDPALPCVSRRAVLTAALGAPAAAMLTGCLGPSWEEVRATRLTIATGNPGGVFDRYGEALADVLKRRLGGVTTRTRATNASVENLQQVADRTSDLGFSLGDSASDAVRGTGEFDAPVKVASLARTYDSFVHLVIRAASPFTEVTDLRGRRVGLGARGSGTRVIAQRTLTAAAAGVTVRGVESTADTLQESADAMRDGDLDAFVFVSGLPNSAVKELSEEIDIRLVDLGGLVGSMTSSYGTEYTAGPVPASTYDLPNAVDTVSVKNYVVVHPDMEEELAYAVTRVMFEEQAAIDLIAPGVRQPNIGAAIFTSPLDLHPGECVLKREKEVVEVSSDEPVDILGGPCGRLKSMLQQGAALE